MVRLKTTLGITVKLFRLSAMMLENWLWIALTICILSPVSLHVRIPYALSYAECDYIGTRGVVSKVGGSFCSPLAIIDTRTGEAVSW